MTQRGRAAAMVALFTWVAFTAACQTAPATQPVASGPLTAGRSVRGNPIDYWVMGTGPETVMIIATIHGNEAAGTPLVEQLHEYLRQQPEYLANRRVVIVPVANPDGFATGRRYNARGVDLNRNFPARNRVESARYGTALSEPESKALFNLIERYTPQRVVSIHQPVNVVDYDGPGAALAGAMGKWSTLPVKRIGSRPGSLGSYVGMELNRPIITLELPRSADKLSKPALWDRFGRMLLAAIVFPNDLGKFEGARAKRAAK